MTRPAEIMQFQAGADNVELNQQYELSQGLAHSARQTTLLGFAAALLASLLTGAALWLLRPTKPSASHG